MYDALGRLPAAAEDGDPGAGGREPTRVATVPLGYEDGIPVSTSNRGHVCIRDLRFPVVGRVSMDFITVEIGDAPVAVGDEVVIFGGSGAMHRSVEEAAADAGTIAYELLVRVGARVPRVLRT